MRQVNAALLIALINCIISLLLCKQVNAFPSQIKSHSFDSRPTKSESLTQSLFIHGINRLNPFKWTEYKDVSASEVIFSSKTPNDFRNLTKQFGWSIGFQSKEGTRGYENQDNFFIRLFSRYDAMTDQQMPTFGVFGVMDGHGPNGHVASSMVVDHLNTLSEFYFQNYSKFEIDALRSFSSPSVQTNGNEKFIENAIIAYLREIFKKISLSISKRPEAGGCTLTLIVWDVPTNKLYTATIGDSLAFHGDITGTKPLTLISGDHGSSNQATQTKLRNAMQNFFKVSPRKSFFKNKISILWETLTSDFRETNDDGQAEVDDDGQAKVDDAANDLSSIFHNNKDLKHNKVVVEEPNDGITDGVQQQQQLDPSHVSRTNSSQAAAAAAANAVVDVDANVVSAGPKKLVAMDHEEEELMALPHLNGQFVNEGTRDGFAVLEYYLEEDPEVFIDCRVGPLQPARSFEQEVKGEYVTPLSFVRSDPEIFVIELAKNNTDYILMTSDGITNPYVYHFNDEIYKQKILHCQVDCLENFVDHFHEWKKNESLPFYDLFDKSYHQFTDAVDQKMRQHLKLLIQNSIKEQKSSQETVDMIMHDTVLITPLEHIINRLNDDQTLLVSLFLTV